MVKVKLIHFSKRAGIRFRFLFLIITHTYIMYKLYTIVKRWCITRKYYLLYFNWFFLPLFVYKYILLRNTDFIRIKTYRVNYTFCERSNKRIVFCFFLWRKSEMYYTNKTAYTYCLNLHNAVARMAKYHANEVLEQKTWESNSRCSNKIGRCHYLKCILLN